MLLYIDYISIFEIEIQNGYIYISNVKLQGLPI